jgi:hypothetical protein
MAKKDNSNIYSQWDILFEEVKTKKQREKVVKELLNYIKSEVKQETESIPLKYEVFRSESNKLLYILRAYKQPEAAVSRNAMPFSTAEDDSTSSLSGPIRPSGPPSPPPPGVASLVAST